MKSFASIAAAILILAAGTAAQTSPDPKMTRVTTQVRTKFGNSDLDLAGEIDKQIALRLATGQLPMSAPALSK